MLQRMMDHNQEREKDDHWQICQHNIVNFLINVCKLPFTPEEVNHGRWSETHLLKMMLVDAVAVAVHIAVDFDVDADCSDWGD